ncbi:MAG: HAMP domain-containing protein [Rhodocyclaceae bacterium]|nr:HAMP domain-containing protein [Rhodocyclaceae bacterium]
MSLRLQINLIIASLMALFLGTLAWQQIQDTAASVREEMQGSHRVATQLLARISWVFSEGGVAGMVKFLQQLGRIRANEVWLYDATGTLVYASPPSPYKAGREAPEWYASLVAPKMVAEQIDILGGRLVIRADASRAILDGWDDLQRLLIISGAAFASINLLVFWLTGRTLKPLRKVVDGLQRMEQGDYSTRLPPLAGREAQLMSQAFNRMAQAVSDNEAARRAAAEATRDLQDNRELTRAIQAHVEDERRAIARELHDELGQSITAIKSMGLAILRRSEGRDAGVSQAAQLIVDTAGHLYDAVHQMIPRLRPFALDSFGLADALADLVAESRAQHANVEVAAHIGELPADLGDTLATAAYRIVQEALTNALRHAHAGRIDLAVRVDQTRLVLCVEDDGVGPPENWDRAGHYGIRGMRERVAQLNGELTLDKGARGGVRMFAWLPLQ